MSFSKSGTDLGLAISGATLAPGKTRSVVEIAAYCGCSKQNIQQIEQRALRKLRHRILFGKDRGKILSSEIR